MTKLVLLVVLIGLVYAHEHGHGHAHNHHHGHHHHHHDLDDQHMEHNPAFKYSRQANEKPAVHSHSHHGHSHDHEHSHEHKTQEDNHNHNHHHQEKRDTSSPKVTSRSKSEIFVQATLSTLMISIAPFVLLFIIPINNNNVENQPLLKVLLGFASGSLLGDAFLHLIPHALAPHDHHHDEHSHSHAHSHDSHDHSQQAIVGLWVLAGIMAFLLVEKIVRNLNGGHTHSHAVHETAPSTSETSDKEEENKPKRKDASKKKDDKKEEEHKCEEDKKQNKLQVAGYLNLVADFSHNFTDGLAIGASYLAGHNIGLMTTVAILFHEVPHEIGDFAVLIQSGCSKRKAIYLQLVTALGALSGTWLSLVFESAASGIATSCILPFTAGGFIYIATVSVIPELKESSGLLQSIFEIAALCAGVAMMVVIALFE